MTPFDPEALVAMLRAFYPIVGGAALLRARSERPEYFAAGVLIGSSQTHLQLADGRIFDLVFSEGAPQGVTRWQALDVTDGGPAVDDPFALEDGPLDPIDESIEWFPPRTAPSMEAVVSEQLGALDGSDAQLDTAHETVVGFDAAGAAAALSGPGLDDAAAAHVATTAALDSDDLGDVVAATDNHGGTIDDHAGAYDEPPPPDLVIDDPGDPPEKTQPGEPGGPAPA